MVLDQKSIFVCHPLELITIVATKMSLVHFLSLCVCPSAEFFLSPLRIFLILLVDTSAFVLSLNFDVTL